jgi:cytochrome c553
MKTNSVTLAIAIAALAAGCATSERSRTLNDPAIPAVTTAQQVCSNCHGIDGNSVSPNFPRLAGQQEAYLAEELADFRSHARSDPPGFEYMWGLSRHLTDDQINGLAAYFSAQKPVPDAPGEPALAARGKDIFEHGVPSKNIPPCASCHGPQGEGSGTFPRIAYQHADYVVKQLIVFQRTDERPHAELMKTVAHQLTEEDMKATAIYLQAFSAR